MTMRKGIKDSDYPLKTTIHKATDVSNNAIQFDKVEATVNIGLSEDDLFVMAKLSENGCHIELKGQNLDIWHVHDTGGYKVASFPVSQNDTVAELVINALKFESLKEGGVLVIVTRLLGAITELV